MATTPTVRDARPDDLPTLQALEAGFPGDRLSPRQFRRHLASPRACLRVLEAGGQVIGYHLVLRRFGSRWARLYSLVVDPAGRGLGLGRQLLADAEARAAAGGARGLRLEVRQDNAAALALYRAAGYRVLAPLPGYYQDGGDGWRLAREFHGP